MTPARTAPADCSPVDAAAAYLADAARSGRRCAVLTGGDPGLRHAAAETFFAGLDEEWHRVHLASPAPGLRPFLEAMLEALGFEAVESSDAELRKLLLVFLRHEAGHGRRTALVVEQPAGWGPHVLETLEVLTGVRAGDKPAALLVLSGDDTLLELLATPGMAALSGYTRPHCSLDAPRNLSGELHDAPAHLADAALAETPAADSEAHGGGRLTVSLEDCVIATYPLERQRMLIGRNEHNDIPIISRYVSRQHALLINRPEGSYLVDLRSTNGTEVNAMKVSQYALRDGDEIGIGAYRLRYENPLHTRRTGLDDLKPVSLADTGIRKARISAAESRASGETTWIIRRSRVNPE